jgi:hypothetical protein
MKTHSKRMFASLLGCLVLCPVLKADIAWLDFQGPGSPTAPLHLSVSSDTGVGVKSGDCTFTLIAENTFTRNRDHADPALRDFVGVDGPESYLSLRISGLAAGSYTVESAHFDRSYPGMISIEGGKVGAPGEILIPRHALSTTPALYSIKSDGVSDFVLTFREANDDDRVRINSLRLRRTEDAPGAPGVFVDIGYSNTTTVSGLPDPFFTTNETDPGFLSGLLWRLRTGFGFDLGGNRDVFEKDANEGVGNAAPLVTIARDLVPGRTYGVYVAFISNVKEDWQVRAGLAPSQLTLFTRSRPAGRVTDLGLSREPNSNRGQYLGFLGNAVASEDGALWLYSDDGDGTDPGWRTRTWLDGFFLGAPVR